MDTKDNLDQTIETYIKEKIANNEPVSVVQFIKDEIEFIASNTDDTEWETMETLWTKRFILVAKRLKANITRAKPGAAAFKAITRDLITKKLNKVSVSTSSPASSVSSSAASKKDSCELTQEAKNEFKQKFEAMKDAQKWKLRDDVYVEDIMYKFGMTCTHEHPVHSFIMNPSDACWKESDFTADDLQTIRTYGDYSLPELGDNLKDMFETYRGPYTDALDFLITKTNSLGPFDPRTNPDEHKLQHVIQQFVGYYVDDVYAGIRSWSEQDFVTHVWSVLDRFFHPLRVTTSRDKTCLATAQRVNSQRAVTGSLEVADKKRSIRPDLVLLKNGLEYGCSELGVNLDSVPEKKEIVETQLHSPKTMKDMLCSAISKVDYDIEVARKLKIVCFNETGLTMSLSVMDCPKGYVSRLLQTTKHEIPRDAEFVTSQLFPILKLALKAKIIVENSLATVNTYLLREKEVCFDFEPTTTKLILPPCLVTPILPATRKRKQSSSESPASSSKRFANSPAMSSSKRSTDQSSASSSKRSTN